MKTAVITMVTTIAIPFVAMAQWGGNGQGGFITMPNLGNNPHPVIYITPTTPGTSYQDFSKPGAIVTKDFDGGFLVSPTTAGTPYRDFSKPSIKIHYTE